MSAETSGRLPSTSSQISVLIAEIAPKYGISVQIEPSQGRVGRLRTPDGRLYYFKGPNVDLNTLGATEVARDKDYAAYFMADLGYPVPRGKAFLNEKWTQIAGSKANRAAALEYAHELGFPIIVKPNSKSHGVGVQKVETYEDFMPAIDRVFNEVMDNVALVQEAVEGDDFRLLVLDNEVMAAYMRKPLQVLGDGNSTIMELLIQKQIQFRQNGRDTRIKLDDPRIAVKLLRGGLNFTSVVATGVEINLLDNANLSSGGEAVDVTDTIDESYKQMAVNLTREMGLRFCGVDIITPEPISRTIGNYTVIEINAAPGVDYYTQIGEAQQEIIRQTYEKILQALLNK